MKTDVFENFRKNCLSIYQFDPAYYYTAPGLSWDAMLKHTSVQLELLTDIDMLMFVERGIRGGLSQCSHRYSEANNKYMDEYDPSKKVVTIIYFDINNQYGASMCQYLPINNFEWLNDLDLNVMNIADDSDIGYILEVDLVDYPDHLHDAHSDLPYCPENKPPPGKTHSKPIAILDKKERYIIHYRNLKQCIKAGIVLKKIHRIVQFRQTPWLKSYIDLNTKMRTIAANDFEKNLYKLMVCAIFGKTMENVRKYSIVKLVTRWDRYSGARKYISQPNFKNLVILDENIVLIELNKTKILFNKPISVGMAILDISKLYLYNFHFDYMKKELKNNCKLLYTDTDSLIYTIENNNIYDLIKRDSFKFDTSDYPPNNIYNIKLLNKKIAGLMKDECKGNIITHFIGLRSKMYMYKIQSKNEINKKVKGVKQSAVKTIKFKEFLDCLYDGTTLVKDQQRIISKSHTVYSIKEKKTALCAKDDKRFLIDKVNTLPWGHFKINN